MKESIPLEQGSPEQPQLFLGCDAHRRYSVFVAMDERGKTSPPVRVEHDRQKFRMFLHRLPPGTPVAAEATGSWYWLVDELEAAGLKPHLAQAFAAKRMLGSGSKKSERGCTSLGHSTAQRTLPETWIPSAELRDLRNSDAHAFSAAPVSDLPEESHCGGN